MARPKKEQNEALEAENQEQTQEAAKDVAKTAKTKPNPYKEYERWKVDVKAIQVEDKDPEAKYNILFVKLLRGRIMIAPKNANELNAQTHNNGFRYVEAGTVNNGDEQIITVSRQKNR